MTPVQFEHLYAAQWASLQALVDSADANPLGGQVDGAQLSVLYRSACEHLALAQARAYPVALRHRLEVLVGRAHRQIYRRQDYGLTRLRQLVLVDFPQSVRMHKTYVLWAFLFTAFPTIALGWVTYFDPGFLLHVMDVRQIDEFESMYSSGSEALGRSRTAGTDFAMFGFYIMNNIGVGFRCFASGLLGGVGSIFFLVYNGLHIGGLAGYISARGYAGNFFEFVVTHSAFELTAIVLSGAAGLRLGVALLAPGRYTRLESLRRAATAAVVVMYGVVGMLIIAAGIEAFWSSSRWIEPNVKYAVGGVCWALVLAYLTWQGRPAKTARKGGHAR